MASLADELLRVPEELRGFVVSQPARELPVLNVRAIKDTTELHLGRRGIEKLWGFDRFTNLEVLWINHNKITAIENLDSCFRIKKLFAHHNAISTLAGSLLSFKFLRELNLAENDLADLDACMETLLQMQYLEHLELRGNPVAQEVDYRLRVIAGVESLRVFDRHVITPLERDEANRKYGAKYRAMRRRIAEGLTGAAARAAAEAEEAGEAKEAASLRDSSRGVSTAAITKTALGFTKGGRLKITTWGAPAETPRLATTDAGKPFFAPFGDTLTQRMLARDVAQSHLDRELRRRADAEAMMAERTRARAAFTVGTGRDGRALLKSAMLHASHAALTVVERSVRETMKTRGCHIPDEDMAAADSTSGAGAEGAAGTATMARPLSPSRLGTVGRLSLAHTGASASASGTKGGGLGGGRPLLSPIRASHTAAAGASRAGLAATGAGAGSLAGPRPHSGPASGGGGGGGGGGAGVAPRSVPSSPVPPLAMSRPGTWVAQSGSSSLAPSGTGSSPSRGAGGAPLAPLAPLASRSALAKTVAKRVEATLALELGEWDMYRLRKLFEEADKDHSGALSRAELRRAMERSADWGFVLAGENEDLEVDDIFDALDTDGSGNVSWKEFLRCLTGDVRVRGHAHGIRFRALTRAEAEARARSHTEHAEEAKHLMLRLPESDPRHATAKQAAHHFGTLAVRMWDLVKQLEGRFDPPERPPTPPKARRDFLTLISTVPKQEAAKRLQRGNRHYRIPRPGEESDSDTDDEAPERPESVEFARYRTRRKARKPHVVITDTVEL